VNAAHPAVGAGPARGGWDLGHAPHSQLADRSGDGRGLGWNFYAYGAWTWGIGGRVGAGRWNLAALFPARRNRRG